MAGHVSQPQSNFMQFLGSAGGAAAFGGIGSLLGGLAGLIGGKSQLEKLQEQLLRQQFQQGETSFGRRGDVFNQAGGLFGQPIVSNSRFNALFNQGNQGEIQRIGSSLQASGIGNSSPIAAATFASLTGGSRARGMFDLLRQGANRDLSLLNLRGSLSR